MTDPRRARPDFGGVREAASGLRPWALIRAASSPALGLPAAERAVFVALARHLDMDGCAWPSAATLADEAGVSERRARQAVKRLAAVGLVTTSHLRGRSLYFEVQAAAVDSYAAAKPKRESAAESAGVAEAEDAASSRPDPETAAEFAGVPRYSVTVITAATPADSARTPAEFARTPAEIAPSAAESAAEVVALRSSFREEGCPDGHRSPSEENSEALEAERHLEAARRSLPERFAPALEGAVRRRGGAMTRRMERARGV